MPANQAEFYDSLVGREYTIATLVEMHGVSRPTVTKWLNAALITPIPDSWPYRYKLEEKINYTFKAIPTNDKAKPKGGKTPPKPEQPKQQVNPKYTKDMLAAYLNHLLKADTELDIAKMFREVSTANDVRNLIKGLEDTLAVAQHYDQFFMEDGLI